MRTTPEACIICKTMMKGELQWQSPINFSPKMGFYFENNPFCSGKRDADQPLASIISLTQQEPQAIPKKNRIKWRNGRMFGHCLYCNRALCENVSVHPSQAILKLRDNTQRTSITLERKREVGRMFNLKSSPQNSCLRFRNGLQTNQRMERLEIFPMRKD